MGKTIFLIFLQLIAKYIKMNLPLTFQSILCGFLQRSTNFLTDKLSQIQYYRWETSLFSFIFVYRQYHSKKEISRLVKSNDKGHFCNYQLIYKDKAPQTHTATSQDQTQASKGVGLEDISSTTTMITEPLMSDLQTLVVQLP